MPVRVGPFVLEKLLGRGGSGEVWRARHRAERLQVAVKIVPAATETAKAAFRAEVHAVAALDHPNVVTVYDTGLLTGRAAAALELEPGSPWLAMELAQGTLLERLLATPMALGWPDRFRVLEAVLAALAHAHARGVVHRDLKPGNVLLGARSADVVLADFGLAWALGRPGADASAKGTPPYMAPEQIRADADAFGPWTDLYAVGCVAYLLAAGRPPFGRGGVREHLDGHLRRAPPPLPYGAPDGFEAWVNVLLRKDPRVRFQRAADALHALRALGSPRAAEPVRRAEVEDEATTIAIGAVDTNATHEGPTPAAPPRAPIPEDWRPGVRPPNLDPHGLVVGLGLVGVRDTPLVGREALRDDLWAELLAVVRGDPRAIVLRGPSGRGRRRLARWLAERAHEVGAVEVLRAEHHRIESAGDGVVPMLLRGRSQLPADVLARLGPLADALRTDGAPGRIEAALQAILALAGPRAPLVVLHEAQWGAEARALAEEGMRRELPILWVLTAQDDERTWPAGFRVVDLPPLADDEHRALVRALLPLAPSLALRVEERTRGEPAFVVQLLRAWIERGWLVRRPGGFRLAVPEKAALVPDLAGVWQERIEVLLKRRPASARRALELAAALGGTVLRAEWRAACREAGVPARDELFDELAEAGVAELDGEGLRFRQPALADALLAEAQAAGRLEELHLACARALARRGEAALLRLAQHLVAAEAWEEAAPVLERVGGRRGGRAELGAWATELRAKALDAMHVGPDDVRRFQLDVDRADVLRAMGDHGEAERLGLRAIERGRRNAFPLSVALSSHGMLLLMQGRDADAEPWLRQSLDESFREGDEGQRAYVLRALARVTGGRGETDEAVRLCEESLAISRKLKLAVGIGYSLVLLADLLDRSHRLDEALARTEQAMAVFERAQMPTSVAQARQMRGNVLMRLGDLAAAGRDLAAAMDVLHLHGWAEWYVAASHLAWVELLEGRTESAERLLARAGEQARRCGAASLLVLHLGGLVVAARRGRWDEWERVHDAVTDEIPSMPVDPRYLWLVGRALEAVAEHPDRAFAVGALARRIEGRLAGRLPA